MTKFRLSHFLLLKLLILVYFTVLKSKYIKEIAKEIPGYLD
ncbi:hypothetical protein QJS64_11610 [Paraclostridium bifermentans]|uniref:Transposase n=1 Tax=Paraclostridium bifermentans TaxID=1490 RepID=A0ABY8QZS0_PARBF|nr:hypothetical protein QJS64_11610 [Paraclostridium bifermentans]